MRKLLLTIIILIHSGFIFCNTPVPFSIDKIGPFKPGMRKIDVERILHKKINISFSESYISSTVNVIYKNSTLTFEFVNLEACIYPDSLTLSSIKTKNKAIRTPSGIGIGSSKLDLFNNFSDDYEIFIYQEFEKDKVTDNYKRVKNKNIFRVRSYDVDTQLDFILYKNKVTEISLQFNEGEGD